MLVSAAIALTAAPIITPTPSLVSLIATAVVVRVGCCFGPGLVAPAGLSGISRIIAPAWGRGLRVAVGLVAISPGGVTGAGIALVAPSLAVLPSFVIVSSRPATVVALLIIVIFLVFRTN